MKNKKALSVKLSVSIIASNEEDNIARCLDSLSGMADEIILVHNDCTDRTVSIAKEYGAKCFEEQWHGHRDQKNISLSKATHSWVFCIDADEAVSEGLQKEIIALFGNGSEPKQKAWRFDIKVLGRFASYPGKFSPSNDPIRFYHKDYAGFKNSTVHDSVVFKEGKEGEVGKFKHMVIHRCFRSFSHAVEKINFYSSMQAENMVARGRKPSALRVVIEPVFSFLKAYTLRRYFLLGLEGFYESVIYAFARTLRFAKATELYRLKKQQEHVKRDS